MGKRKEPIDHVLPWVRSDIYGMDLTRIVIRIPLEDVVAQLVERGRYFKPEPAPRVVKPKAEVKKKLRPIALGVRPTVEQLQQLQRRYALRQIGAIK